MVGNQALQHRGLKIYLISYEIGSCHNSCDFMMKTGPLHAWLK